MGAAGSGERGYDSAAYGGMGRVVYQSFRTLEGQLQQDGRTITAEAVEYPAIDVPEDAGVLDWADFIGSVDKGTAALGGQYAAFTQRCPDTKVVLAGYSQGAMVVHRNLHALADSPNLAAALLVADGDRIPGDTTIKSVRRRRGLTISAVPRRTGPFWRMRPPRSCLRTSVSAPSACVTPETRSATTTPMPKTRCRRRRGDSHQLRRPHGRWRNVDLDAAPTSRGAVNGDTRGRHHYLTTPRQRRLFGLI